MFSADCLLYTGFFRQFFTFLESGKFLSAGICNLQCDVVVTNLLVAGVFLLIVSGALDIESPMCLLPVL